jgi:SAM-dependent methyltransferase
LIRKTARHDTASVSSAHQRADRGRDRSQACSRADRRPLSRSGGVLKLRLGRGQRRSGCTEDTVKFENLTVETDGPVATITLNRLQALNALSAGLIADYDAALTALAPGDKVRVIRLRGAGRAFCSGYDLSRSGDRCCGCARALGSGVGSVSVTPDERWLATVWPIVRSSLPAPPARVVEIGCGPLGGFIPMLEPAGYEATGVDPEAPRGPSYRKVEIERYDMPGQLDAIVACTSLHHVADLAAVLDVVDAALVPGGVVVIVEWARERFDEATARWCFARLPEPVGEPGWLDQRQAEWRESGQPWEAYLRSWADGEGLHRGQDILDELDARFDSEPVTYGPYFFPDLADTTEADEQAVIDRGLIQANRIEYVGRRRSHIPAPSA